uniref:Cytochrome b-c1 complex subunit 9 n=2 Tax=Echeneis naucrates TaxID=173247 RepID=A0A665U0V2_ECHNA
SLKRVVKLEQLYGKIRCSLSSEITVDKCQQYNLRYVYRALRPQTLCLYYFLTADVCGYHFRPCALSPTNMALVKSVYNLLFRRTSTFAITIMVGAVLFERMFDQGGDTIFEQMNKGKLWKHIKHNYESNEEE